MKYSSWTQLDKLNSSPYIEKKTCKFCHKKFYRKTRRKVWRNHHFVRSMNAVTCSNICSKEFFAYRRKYKPKPPAPQALYTVVSLAGKP